MTSSEQIYQKIFILFILIIVIVYLYTPSFQFIKQSSKVVAATLLSKQPLCKLKVPNPWDPTILKYLEHKKLECGSEILSIIYLENLYIKINETLAKNETNCEWKCVSFTTDKIYKEGEWTSITIPVNCDTFHVRCYTNENVTNVYYEVPHTVIIPKQLNQTNNIKGYNLHILVLDSVSRSLAIRSLPKTLNYLINELEAMDFMFYNKLAFNSYPNANAAFFGKHPNNSRTAPMFVTNFQDNQTFEKHYIGNIFENNNFATLLNEEIYTAFPTEKLNPMHMLHPLFVKNWNVMAKCPLLTNKFTLDYWSQFISIYGKKLKFSLNWTTLLSHDGPNLLYAADDMTLNLLMKHKDEFDNSFFIFMGDHGLTFGFPRFEKVMAYEDSNPMFFISLPKALRSDTKLVKTLKENSQKLTSHYDLYATFIEISKMLKLEIPNDITLHGKSLFQEIPDNRDCYSMGIPPPYCLCRFNEKPLSLKDSLHGKIIDAIINEANTALMPYRNTCIIFEKDPNFVPEIIELSVENSKNHKVFKVTFQTKYFDHNSRWWTYVYVDLSEKEIKNMLDFGQRIDPYGNGRRCLTDKFWFCYCNNVG